MTEIVVPAQVASDVNITQLDADPAFVYLAKLQAGPSRSTMGAALLRIAQYFGAKELRGFPWGSLRYVHTVALRSWLAETFSPATGNRWLSALRGTLRAAWRLGLMSIEELERASDLDRIRGSRLLRGRAVAMHELERLFTAAKRDKFVRRGLRDAALVAVLYGAGLRCAEAVKLELSSLGEEEDVGFLAVHGKGNKERKVFLPHDARRVLERWVRVRGKRPGPLFVRVTQNGVLTSKPLRLDLPGSILCKLQRRCDVAHFSPHDLRRTFIGDLLDAGADLSTVQQLAGHADVSTTVRYDRRTDRTRMRAAQLLHLPAF